MNLKHKTRVLLAEDEDATRSTISLILSASGCVVHESETGAEVMATLDKLEARGLAVDLLILDIEIAGLRGIQLLDAVRASGRDMPAILIVGLTSLDLASQARRFRNLSFLPRPFDPEQLENAVAAALGIG